jgi:hypothetical protein
MDRDVLIARNNNLGYGVEGGNRVTALKSTSSVVPLRACV